MEIIKNIAAVLNLIIAASAVLGLFSKNTRAAIAKFFTKFGNNKVVEETKQMLEEHIKEDQEFKKEIKEINGINRQFIENQCRSIIKDTFYKYKDTRTLPLYEKKTLNYIKSLYIDRLGCNTYAKTLLLEMDKWEVDYNDSIEGSSSNDH